MKVSINWLRQFTDIDIPVDELLEKIGAQLGGIEGVVDLSKQYEGVLVARVIQCEKHPNADKLNVCLIDDGGVAKDVDRNEQGLVQVVCGAPNVREGLLVAWLPPGTTVPSSFDKDPFVLGARELRGVQSNGMLASAHELAIGDDHNGIVELELQVAPGTAFAEAYGLNDTVIDIENKMFTHRPDCFGILGIAREVAGIQQKAFTSPEWYIQALDRIKPGKTKLDLQVANNALKQVPRFMAITMADVTVRPSPFVLQTYLSRVGIRPINNIVDTTNYLMVLTGQPLHAYDADKLKQYGPLSLETRMSKPGDTLRLLNGKDLELKDDGTVLITSNDVPVGIAGVMGGADTEVDETTKNIVIECANFDMYAIRRASMKHGLFTDAVTRFNKGQSKLQNERVLEEAVALTQALSGGHVASNVYDVHEELIPPQPITTTPDFINSRLGVSLKAEEIASLLRNVELTVQVHGQELAVEPPFWRTDLEIAEDIVEEVGRLYGYDRLPLELPSRSLAPVKPDPDLIVKKILRERLARAGANEVLTYGFVHGNLLSKTGQDPEKAFKLSNAISPDLQYFRLSLTPSLLEKIHPNVKAGYAEFVLFELGKVHAKTEMDQEDLPKEFGRLGAIVTRNGKSVVGTAYYQAKYYAEYALGLATHELQYKRLDTVDISDHAMFEQMIAPFEPTRAAVISTLSGKLLGVVGEYKRTVVKAFKLPEYSAGFELFLTPLQEVIASQSANYTQLSRYPSTEQDITLRVANDISFQTVEQLIFGILQSQENVIASLQPLSIFQKPGETEYKQVSFRITLSSYLKTMTSDEVTVLLEAIAVQAADAFDAVRI